MCRHISLIQSIVAKQKANQLTESFTANISYMWDDWLVDLNKKSIFQPMG